jgi:hypothetical protein
MAKISTAVTVERGTPCMTELMEGTILSKTGKSINIPGRSQQFHLYQQRAKDRRQKDL